MLLLNISVLAQNDTIIDLQNKNIKKVEIDIFAGYYGQDGEHSAVEGGIGTQKLDASESFIFIHVVNDSVNSYDLNIGVDAYSSASSDKIDKYETRASYVSSASSSDVRPNFNVKYTRKIKKHSISPKFAFSHEFDVNSISGGLDYSYLFNKENTELSLSYEFFYDTWKLIYPTEIANLPGYEVEGNERFDTDIRNTSAISFVYSQVLTKKIQMAFLSDYVKQNGILFTPFHRVYFNDGVSQEDQEIKTVKAEYLPNDRYKMPVGLRLNWFMTDFLVSRFYYRYYYDNFDVKGNTFDVNLAFKAGNSFVFTPFFRYYNQTAAKYFYEYGEAPLDAEFYTSDYDLSEFTSQKYGLSVKFSPVFGIGRMKFPSKKHVTTLKSIELRYANYNRSDGLQANIFSFMLSVKY